MKVNLTHMDPKLAPQMLERCGKCDHIQNFHLSISTVDPRFIEGKPVPCRHSECSCTTWKPTWGVR